jgi:hypothetical protein
MSKKGLTFQVSSDIINKLSPRQNEKNSSKTDLVQSLGKALNGGAKRKKSVIRKQRTTKKLQKTSEKGLTNERKRGIMNKFHESGTKVKKTKRFTNR